MNVGTEHTCATKRIGVFVLFLIALCSFVPSAFAFTIQVDDTGGECTEIGSWDLETKTCTLTGDATGTLSVVGNGFYPSRTEGITIDGAGYTLEGDGTDIGLYAEGLAFGLTLKNITLNHFQIGISLRSTNQTNDDTKGVRIENVSITNTPSGFLGAYDYHTRINNLSIDGAQSVLQTGGSKDFSLKGLNATHIPRTTPTGNNSGILIGFDTDGSSLEDITMSGDTDPLVLQNARNIRLRNIRIEGYPINLGRLDGTQHGTFFQMEGRELAEYTHDIDDSVTVNGTPVRYFLNRSNETFDIGDAAALICISCDHITLKNADIAHTHHGILLYDTKHSTLQNATATEAIYGIALYGSTDNVITGYTFGENWHDVSLQPSMKQIGWNYGPVYGPDIQSTGNVFSRNTFTDTAKNPLSVSDGSAPANPNANTYSLPLPEGGNYWASFDESSEGCTDENTDGLCDNPYHLPNAQGGTLLDEYPWVSPQAWQQATGTPPVPTCTDHCVSNVAFLPGLEASRLYEDNSWLGGEDQLWEPTNANDVPELALDANGNSLTPNVYTKDVIDTGRLLGVVGVYNVYKEFLAELASLKNAGTITDWAALPYDWRFDPRDIIADGVAYPNGELRRMEATIESLAANSKTGKVTLVAHSMGGHVAKVLVDALNAQGKAHLIDRIIFVAVPHLGTPKAIAGLLHGYDQEIPAKEHLFSGILVSSADARALGLTLPSAYNLLPSSAYFAKVFDPVVDLTNARSLQTDALPVYLVRDYDSLQTFLTAKGSPARSSQNESDTEDPTILDKAKLLRADTFHDAYDSWTPPPGIDTANIIGWGVETVRGVAYTEKKDGNAYAYHPDPILTLEGDKTVVWPSAAGEGERYFVDLLSLQKFPNASDSDKEADHANLLESTPVRSLLRNLLTHTATTSLPAFVSSTKPENIATSTLRLSVYSPADLHLYDSEGRHTGRIPSEDGFIHYEEQIPGTTYLELGESKHIIAPEGTYRAALNGTGEGTFDFIVRKGNTNSTEEEPIATYADVPVTPETVADVAISATTPPVPLSLDENGDGTEDQTILPEETVPPSFTDLLTDLSQAIAHAATSPATKDTLKKQTDRAAILYQKLLTFREERTERKQTFTNRLDTTTAARFDALDAYLATLAALPPAKKRALTQTQEAQLNALLADIASSLQPDPDSGLPPEPEAVHAGFTEAKTTLATLSLPAPVAKTLSASIDRSEVRYDRTTLRLGTFDERTKRGEERLKAAIATTLANLNVNIARLASLPGKNKKHLTAEDAVKLQAIVTKLINLIPSL